MIFRLPPSLGNKRNNSINIKKPRINYASQDELDNLRSKSTTPSKILQSLPKNDSITYPTKFPINNHSFDSPEPQKSDFRHNISLADIRLMNNANSPNKPSPILEPRRAIHKTSEEKPITPFKDLQKSNKNSKFLIETQKTKKSQKEKLKNIQKFEAKQNSVLKNLKMISKELKVAVGVFVKKIKEEIEKICFLVLEKEFKFEALNIKEAFNQGLDGLANVLGGKVEKWKFGDDEEDGRMRKTGKFESLEQSRGDWKDQDSRRVVREVVAMSGFKASDYGQLDFSPGDRIQVLKTDDSRWWLGRIGEKVGRIPSHLVMLD